MDTPLWVFGYGSLLWNPGFEVAERRLSTLAGYRRSFCMWSIHHRGTPDNPGLVLALDRAPQGQCLGLALRAAPGTEADTLAYLRERELVSSAYVEEQVSLTTEGGEALQAVAYVVAEDHVQYCGGLTLQAQADVIRGARGGRGPNDEYLYNTVEILDQLGISDPDLVRLAHMVRA